MILCIQLLKFQTGFAHLSLAFISVCFSVRLSPNKHVSLSVLKLIALMLKKKKSYIYIFARYPRYQTIIETVLN